MTYKEVENTGLRGGSYPGDLLIRMDPGANDFVSMFIEEPADGMRRLFVTIGAVDLGLFDVMHAPHTADEAADELGIEPVYARLLCDSLDTIGLLLYSDGRYVNTEDASRFLVSDSPMFIGTTISRTMERALVWTRLDGILRNGPEIVDRSRLFSGDWIESIGERARGGDTAAVVEHIRTHVDLSGARSMLDLAGGHGLYAIALCRAYPEMKGTVFDVPAIIPVARRNIEAYGMTGMTTIEGDYYKDPIGGPYDVLFTSFNNACADPKLLDKIVPAISEGGHLIVRRHREHVAQNPLVNLESNLRITDMANFGKASRGSHIQGKEEYDETLIRSGFEMISDVVLDDTSSILIFQKNGEPDCSSCMTGPKYGGA